MMAARTSLFSHPMLRNRRGAMAPDPQPKRSADVSTQRRHAAVVFGRRRFVTTACRPIVLLLVAACAADVTACSERAVEHGHAVHVNFADSPDGPAPRRFGNGFATIITTPLTDPTARFHIQNGRLTSEPTMDGPSASYFSSPNMGAHIANIGARWTFAAQYGTQGTMLLMVSQNVLTPPIALQVEITPAGWSVGVRPAADTDISSLEILQSGPFKKPLNQNGSDTYECEVWIAGERAEIELPTGERKVIRDPRIAQWAGPHATFVAYSANGRTDSRVGFKEVWAATESGGRSQ